MKTEKLHTYLKTRRLNLGLTLREVSKRSNGKISNPCVSQLENGRYDNPTPQTLAHLAKALKCDYMKLMRLAGYV